MNGIGIIGLGTMGTALAKGLHRAFPRLQIFGTRRTAARMPAFVTPCRDNSELVKNARLIFLCVKPYQAKAILQEIRPVLSGDHVLISTCAGVTIDDLCRALSASANVIRAMPNIACELGESVTAVCFPRRAQQRDGSEIVALLESLGKTVALEERHFDAVTAVSGCGPAYALLIVEALIDGAVKQGLPRSAARILVAQTLLGSARLVLESDAHPAEMRDRVTTPAGCTIEALACLEERNLRAALISAVGAAARRASELDETRAAEEPYIALEAS